MFTDAYHKVVFLFTFPFLLTCKIYAFNSAPLYTGRILPFTLPSAHPQSPKHTIPSLSFMLQQHTHFPFPHPFISLCELQPSFSHFCCLYLPLNIIISGFNNLTYLPLFCRLPIYLSKQTGCMTSLSWLVLLRAGNSASVLFPLLLPALRGRRIRFGRPETDRTADKTDCAIYMLLCTVTLCYLLRRIHSLLHCENAKELR